MAIQLSEELLAALKANVDADGKVSFTGKGVLDEAAKTLEVEMIDDQTVGPDEEEEGEEAEEGTEGEAGEEKPMKMHGKEGQGGPGMGIIAMFKKGAGYEK